MFREPKSLKPTESTPVAVIPPEVKEPEPVLPEATPALSEEAAAPSPEVSDEPPLPRPAPAVHAKRRARHHSMAFSTRTQRSVASATPAVVLPAPAPLAEPAVPSNFALNLGIEVATLSFKEPAAETFSESLLLASMAGQYDFSKRFLIRSKITAPLAVLRHSQNNYVYYWSAEVGGEYTLMGINSQTSLAAVLAYNYATNFGGTQNVGFENIYGPELGMKLYLPVKSGGTFSLLGKFSFIQNGFSFYTPTSSRLGLEAAYFWAPGKTLLGARPGIVMNFSTLNLQLDDGKFRHVFTSVGAAFEF